MPSPAAPIRRNQRVLAAVVAAGLLVTAAPALAEELPLEQRPATESSLFADPSTPLQGAVDDEVAAFSTRSSTVTLPSTPAPIEFRGGGWGHGVGMSQFGAYEMARTGSSATQIIQHYYAGTAVTDRAMPGDFRVGLRRAGTATPATLHFPSMRITALDQPIVWDLCTTRFGGCAAAWTQPVGSNVIVGSTADGRLILREGETRHIDTAGVTFLRARLGTGSTPRTVRIDEKNARYRWGHLEIRLPNAGHAGVRATISFAAAFERYVYGIQEVPFSWPAASLQAQAITARSYAVARSGVRADCDCWVTDGTENQVYRGAEPELAAGGSNWRAAVDATAGRVVTYNGAPIIAFYASSHNRRSESVTDVWGGQQPYHTSVADPYSATSANPHRAWVAPIGNAAVAARVTGISLVTYVRVVERTPGGMPRRIEVHGRDPNGQPVVRELTGARSIGLELRSWFGLRSGQIDVISPSPFPDTWEHRHRSHVYDIAQLSRAGLTEGCGAPGYCPARPTTRGEMAAFLWRMAGQPTPVARHPFPDVSANRYYDPAVSWLYEQGITDGYGATGRFEPDLDVTRAQMAAFLHRLAGEPTPGVRHTFPDVPRTSYYDRPVSWLLAQGITDGVGNTGLYRPHDPTTRAQMASFIIRYLEAR